MTQPSHRASFTVLGGSLAGRSYATDQAAEEILIGSDAGCSLCIDLPGVSPVHARVWLEADGGTVHDAQSPAGLYLNDARVEGQAALSDGDIVWLGEPGGATSVMVQCRVHPIAAPSVAGPAPDEAFLVEAQAEPVPEPPGDFLVEPVVEVAPSEDASYGFEPVPEAAAAAVPAAADGGFAFVPEEAAPVAAAESPFAEEALPLEPPAAGDAFAAEAGPAFPGAGEAAAGVFETPAEAFVADEPPAPVEPPPAPVALPPEPPRPEYTDVPSIVAPPRPVAAPAVPPLPKVERPAVPGGRRPVAKKSGPGAAVYAAAGVAVLALLGGGFLALGWMKTPRVASANPTRVPAGRTVTLVGERFGTDAGAVSVTIGGSAARVVSLSADATRLEVEVPEAAAPPAGEAAAPVVVAVAGRAAKPLGLTVYRAPSVSKVTPDVGLPGAEVLLTGQGWAAGAQVRFGSATAEVLESKPNSLRVKVPALDVVEGAAVPVVVTSGADSSKAVEFLLGQLPLVASAEPATVGAGEVLVIKGRGFAPRPADNQVDVLGTSALVVAATESELKVVVPWATPGEGSVEVRVLGVENPGRRSLTVKDPGPIVPFRLVAVPWVDQPGHDHAALATALGPAFVLSGSGGRSAAERAFEAQGRFDAAAVPLRSTLGLELAEKGLESNPVVGLQGRPEVVLEVTAEDAAGYDEDWTGLKGRGGPVTRGRLARWWGAVARDLATLLVRDEQPRAAAALAAEGRVLGEVYAAARKTGAAGVPFSVVTGAKPALLQSLRVLAARVPAAVAEPVMATATGPGPGAAPGAPEGPAVEFRGGWTGFEVVEDMRKYVSLDVRGNGGTFRYEGALGLTVPLQGVQNQKGVIRFSIRLGKGGTRYYAGRWDGSKLTGLIFTDPAGKNRVGEFELTPLR